MLIGVSIVLILFLHTIIKSCKCHFENIFTNTFCGKPYVVCLCFLSSVKGFHAFYVVSCKLKDTFL